MRCVAGEFKFPKFYVAREPATRQRNRPRQLCPLFGMGGIWGERKGAKMVSCIEIRNRLFKTNISKLLLSHLHSGQ